MSEFCDTVTGYSEIDDLGNSQFLGGGYYAHQGEGSVMTGFKSNAFLANQRNLDGKVSPKSILKNSSGTDQNFFSRGGKPIKRLYSKVFIPEYILDVWTDCIPNDRCSISFLVESGTNKHKELNVRISTDGYFLVITKKMSEIALSAKKGIKDLIIRKDKSFVEDKTKASLLDNHGKITGRKTTVAQICKRQVTRHPQVELEARLPLPFKCRKAFTKKDDGDDLFFGKKFMRYDNQSIWCVCEMISCVTDEYKAMDDIPEEEVIDVDENHFNSASSTNQENPTRSSPTFFQTSGNFSVGTIKTSSEPALFQGTKRKGRQNSTTCSHIPKKEVNNNKDTPVKKNTVEGSKLYQQPSRVIQESVYLSPTNTADGSNPFFSTPPETQKPLLVFFLFVVV